MIFSDIETAEEKEGQSKIIFIKNYFTHKITFLDPYFKWFHSEGSKADFFYIYFSFGHPQQKDLKRQEFSGMVCIKVF